MRSTTISAATRAARCSVARRPDGSRCAPPTHSLRSRAILLRVLDRWSTKTTESSLDLWVPRSRNRMLELPLDLEAALIGAAGVSGRAFAAGVFR